MEAVPMCMKGEMNIIEWAPVGVLSREAFSWCSLSSGALESLLSTAGKTRAALGSRSDRAGQTWLKAKVCTACLS